MQGQPLEPPAKAQSSRARGGELWWVDLLFAYFGFFLSPDAVNATIAGLKPGEGAIGRSVFCPIQI
jgi:hypothetical protein